MLGIIKSIPKSESGLANYAFIRGKDGKEYFLHISGFLDSWDDLKKMISMKKIAEIEFQVEESPRGPRATNARIINGSE